ncbi:hypothetical protein B4084_0686 [Bacillus cereus]|nr:hypothetical protein B4084_0686 [Bacillus cereus]
MIYVRMENAFETKSFYDISYPIEGYGGEMESSDYFLF